MRHRALATLSVLGPGFAVAATGVGAGDVVTAAVEKFPEPKRQRYLQGLG